MRNRRFKKGITFSTGVLIGIIFTLILNNFLLSSMMTRHKTKVIIEKKSYQALFSDDEDNIEPEFIFIAVILKENPIERARAISRTWGKNIDGRVTFFVDQSDVISIEGIADIPVEGIKNLNYNTFESLIEIYNYMSADFRKRYRFYMITHSDTYIETSNLPKFIKYANKNDLIVQTLFANLPFDILRKKRFDLLCIDDNVFIISRHSLILLSSILDQCLSGGSFYWIFQNMNWQTCFQQVLGIPCSVPPTPIDQLKLEKVAIFSPVQEQNMFHLYHYLQGLKINRLETSILDSQREKFDILRGEIAPSNESTTPKNYSLSVDSHLEGFFADGLGTEVTSRDKLRCGFRSNSFSGSGGDSLDFLYDSNPGGSWDYLPTDNGGEAFVLNGQLTFDLNQTVSYVKEVMLQQQQQHEGMKKSDIAFTLFRHCSSYGAQFRFGIKTVPNSKQKINFVNYQIPFGPLWVREAPLKRDNLSTSPTNDIIIIPEELKNYVEDVEENAPKIDDAAKKKSDDGDAYDDTDKNVIDANKDGMGPKVGGERIEMIVALSGRFKTFYRFMENYEKEVILRRENVGLTVSLYGPDDEDRRANAKLVSEYKDKYPEETIFVIKGGKSDSKSQALTLAVSDFEGSEALLFVIDVDMVFKAEIFHRIRWFTIPGKQAYFPIVFSEYSPEMSRGLSAGSEYQHFQYEEPYGFWRLFGWGMVSIYYSDLIKAGGYDTNIYGWGEEDVDLSERVIKSLPNVIRLPEPGLVHVYHEKHCASIVDWKEYKKRGLWCKNSASSVFASTSKIAATLLADADTSKKHVFKFAKKYVKSLKMRRIRGGRAWKRPVPNRRPKNKKLPL